MAVIVAAVPYLSQTATSSATSAAKRSMYSFPRLPLSHLIDSASENGMASPESTRPNQLRSARVREFVHAGYDPNHGQVESIFEIRFQGGVG